MLLEGECIKEFIKPIGLRMKFMEKLKIFKGDMVITELELFL